MSLQRILPMNLGRVRPLLSVNAVMGLIDASEDDVLTLVHGAQLSFAFDIASKGCRRAALRIWADCVKAHLNGQPQPNPLLPVEQVIAAILPSTNLPVRGTSLARLLNCSSGLVNRLVNDGSLRGTRAPGAIGVNSSPLIERVSIVHFLTTRRVGAAVVAADVRRLTPSQRKTA